MKKAYAIANLLVIIAVIYWNYLVNTLGIKGNTVGSLSNEYANLFTPASYAFAIWGLIFLGLIAHGIFQIKRVFWDKKGDDFVEKIGPWLIIANICNASWLWFWLNESTGVTIFIMLFMLFSLLTICVRLGLEQQKTSLSMQLLVWWPISLYSGWITVATVANISAYLAKIEFQALFSETVWATLMISIATLIYLFLVRQRNMWKFATVGVWALVAISRKHWDSIPVLQWIALVAALLLAAAIVFKIYQNSRNGAAKSLA